MKSEGLAVKDRIEGPPPRKHPILLRQTSFLALQESIQFPTSELTVVDGNHRSRFGEIEQRGAAVTGQGRRLYNQILSRALQAVAQSGSEAAFQSVFEEYPDDFQTLLGQSLVFCTFYPTVEPQGCSAESCKQPVMLSNLLRQGVVGAKFSTYEDFLLVSAAGIFRSNLLTPSLSNQKSIFDASEDRLGFEAALGCSVLDSDRLYKTAEVESLAACAHALGLQEIIDDRQELASG